MLRKIIQFIASGPESFARKLYLCAFSAVLLILPFFNSNLWIFSWFGFLPLFFVLKNQSSSKAFLFSFICGFIFWLGTIYWLIHVTVPGMIILSLYLALYFAIFGLFFSKTRNFFIIPSVWVTLEYLRSYLFTGFPWALLGYSQFQNVGIIQIADITGVYGVSFLVVLVNLGIYLVLSRQLPLATNKKKYLLILLCLCLVLGYGYYKLKLSDKFAQAARAEYNPAAVKISVIQPNIPQSLKWNPSAKDKILAKYFLLTQEASKDNPDIIIWPETALQDYLTIAKTEYSEIEYLRSFIKQINIPILLGVITHWAGNEAGADSYYNSAVLFSKDARIKQRYDKLHLVPFGEYIPLRGIIPSLDDIVGISDFTKGEDYTLFSLKKANLRENRKSEMKFGVLICFEDLFSGLSRNFVRQGADILINITNDAWFMDTSEPHQHLAASVFRAVENRISLLRSANTGVSCFITPMGIIKSRVSDNKGKDTFLAGHRTEFVYKKAKDSIYTKYGDVFVLFCFIIMGVGMILKLKR